MSDKPHADEHHGEDHGKNPKMRSYLERGIGFCILLIILKFCYTIGDGKFSMPDLWPFNNTENEEVVIIEIPSYGKKIYKTDNRNKNIFKLKNGHTDSIYFYNTEFPENLCYLDDREDNVPKESDGKFTTWEFKSTAYQITKISITTKK
jgi:hypothetical protein